MDPSLEPPEKFNDKQPELCLECGETKPREELIIGGISVLNSILDVFETGLDNAEPSDATFIKENKLLTDIKSLTHFMLILLPKWMEVCCVYFLMVNMRHEAF